MEDYEGDALCALKAFQDELEGIKEYKASALKVVDPDLKMIMTQAMEAERGHAKSLLNWINKHLQL